MTPKKNKDDDTHSAIPFPCLFLLFFCSSQQEGKMKRTMADRELGLLDGVHAELESEEDTAKVVPLLLARVRRVLRSLCRPERQWEALGRVLRTVGTEAWPELGVGPAVVALLPRRELPPHLDHPDRPALRQERRPRAWLALFVAVVRRWHPSRGVTALTHGPGVAVSSPLALVAQEGDPGPPLGTMELALQDQTWAVSWPGQGIDEAASSSVVSATERQSVDGWRGLVVLALLARSDRDLHPEAEPPVDAVKRALVWTQHRRAPGGSIEDPLLMRAAVAAARERLGGRLTGDILGGAELAAAAAR